MTEKNIKRKHPLPHPSSPKAVKWYRLWEGLKRIFTSRIGNIISITVAITSILAYRHYHAIILQRDDVVEGISLIKAETISLIIMIVLIDIVVFLISTIPFSALRHTSNFRSVGLYNRIYQAPDLLSRKRENDMIVYQYYVSGIAVKDFEKVRLQLETAFNRHIIKIREGKSKNRILIYTRKKGVPKHVPFDTAYVPQNENEIALGISGDGIRILNLDKTPMVFSGGETGSGKTVMLRASLYQAHHHGADIYLYDGKGFVDFTSYEINRYHCIDRKEELLDRLKDIVAEIQNRKDMFKECECKNISEYNEQESIEPIRRIILATDEVGEMFEKKGLKGAERELVESIEKEMNHIARLGRAFGIHLWLSTQRGDADTIPPQIRSNLTYRVCGKASDVLSRLTIDSGLATEITADQKGRFVDNENVFFQAFDFKEPDHYDIQ